MYCRRFFPHCCVGGSKEEGGVQARSLAAPRQFCWGVVSVSTSCIYASPNSEGGRQAPAGVLRINQLIFARLFVLLASFSQIVSKVAQGHIDLHRIEQAVGGDCDRAVRIRRQALERLRSAVDV